MSEKYRHLTTGFIWATVGLGVAYIVRRYRCNIIKKLKPFSPTKKELVLSENVILVNTYEECQRTAQILHRKCMDYRVLGFDCEWVTTKSRRPVALMQLSSADGYCALVRLCVLDDIPQILKSILADPTIYKVGVVPSDDAHYLMLDYGLVVRGCLDLRHLKARSGILSKGGLSGMAESLLGVEMDKSWRIRCSDWEASELSTVQKHYASQDAIVAIDIFSHLVPFHKELGVKVSDNPLTVQLLFEPSGRVVDEVGLYYIQEKENRCVVCGTSESYIRKNIVPHEYRKHFPATMKDHISHDILLLCVSCHSRSNGFDTMLRQQLAVECNAPIGNSEDCKMFEIPELKQVRSAARALLSPSASEIPEKRREELKQIVMQHLGEPECGQLTTTMLEEANNVVVSVMNKNYEPHGLRVMLHFSSSQNGGLLMLERRWREHFLETMRPRYLPALWSVQHNHERLKQKLAQGRINPEDVAIAGLTPA